MGARTSRPCGPDLVVVESPGKARTIQELLGPAYRVRATAGHLVDLPPNRLGVDLEHGFAPCYELVRGKGKVLSDLKRAAREAGAVYLATDPDREGEAIAWLLAVDLGAEGGNHRVRRALLQALTPAALRRALAEAGPLDRCRFEAQQARRVLDRLVGFQASPVLWRRIRPGLAAGRVLSVAVRLVVDRERARRDFAPEAWSAVEAELQAAPGAALRARLLGDDGPGEWRGDPGEARRRGEALAGARFAVASLERAERREPPPPPFTTAALLQEAARRLGFPARKTMALAQRLYEGLPLGDEGRVGLITYPRSDSVRMDDAAAALARAAAEAAFGPGLVPAHPPGHRDRPRAAPMAHEAVRPADLERSPDEVGALLRDQGERDLARLYRLVWERTVASQMADAVHEEIRLEVGATLAGGARARLCAAVATPPFAGWRALLHPEAGGGGPPPPAPRPGEPLRLLAAAPLALATAPLPRFDEAGLLAELEARGIGRPSTFAATLEAILEKGYVEKVERDYRPTALGTRVTEVLCAAFPRELEVDFTAAVEAQLDAVEAGTTGWQEVVAGFHAGFGEELRRAGAEPDAAAPGIACRRCGKPMALRLGRRGEFLACTGWPACPESMDFRREGDRVVPLGPEAAAQGQRCPACGAPLLARRGRFGSFLACSRAPACRASVPLPTGVPCPRGCGGQVALRRNQRGRSYYGCSSYPRCDFVSWDRPRAEPCPQCGGPFLVDRFSRGEGATVACPDRRCGYRRVAPLEPDPGAGQGGPAVPPSSSGPPGGGKTPGLA